MLIVAAQASCVLPAVISEYIISEDFKYSDIPGTLSSVPESVLGLLAKFPLHLQHMSLEHGPGARLLVQVLYAVSKIGGYKRLKEEPTAQASAELRIRLEVFTMRDHGRA